MDLPELDNLSPSQRIELSRLVKLYEESDKRDKAQNHFMDFVRTVWHGFIEGRHHRDVAEAFEKVANGELKRLIIAMPPRHTKSMFCSVYFPAWFLGKNPTKKIIQASNTAELAVGFGRQVKNIVSSKEFKNIFPDVGLQVDSKAAGRWSTNHQGGEYFAIGAGGTVAGRGADVLVIDDPHSEQEAALAEFNPEVFDKVYEWYTSGPRQRLQPGGAIIILVTRWGKADLVGRVLEDMANGKDQWHVIEFPAILPSGKPLWPEYWKLEELLATKASLPLHKWNAQYQQNPTSDASALIKREWWQDWPRKTAPECDIIIASFDTAFAKTDRANYSACTTWGVFMHDDPDTGARVPCLILLDAWRDKLSFPELKSRAKEHYEEFKPDIMLIEEKAAGAPLIYELRAMGVPVQSFAPARGNDKISRVNAVTDIFASKRVYARLGSPSAQEVIEEVAEFPAGRYDDYVDTVSQALLRFRQGGFIQTKNDDWGPSIVRRRKREYY